MYCLDLTILTYKSENNLLSALSVQSELPVSFLMLSWHRITESLYLYKMREAMSSSLVANCKEVAEINYTGFPLMMSY